MLYMWFIGSVEGIGYLCFLVFWCVCSTLFIVLHLSLTNRNKGNSYKLPYNTGKMKNYSTGRLAKLEFCGYGFYT